MKTALRSLLWALAAAFGAAQAQVQAPAPPASAPARAASAPSPATAAENARMPGELRPEQPVVPQIAVPLRRDGAVAPSDATSSTVGGVDDSAARCRAEKTKSARAACERRAASAAGSGEARKR